MKKNSELVFFLIIVGISILMLALVSYLRTPHQLGASGQEARIENPFAVASEVFDFGTIPLNGGLVHTRFTLENQSAQSIRIGKIYTSCMCTGAKFMYGDIQKGPFGMPGHGYVPSVNEEIPQGGEFVIEVTFDPAAHGPAGVGYIERSVYVETDAGIAELLIKATVKP